MPGYGSRSWKQPRQLICCDCRTPFETYATNTERCKACQRANRRATWRRYNHKRALDKNVEMLEIQKNDCFRCPYLNRCRQIIQTQAPVMCQRGDRIRMRASEIARLEAQPAYLPEMIRLFSLQFG